MAIHFKLNEAEMNEFQRLADIALPVDDAEWGSERQVEAQNHFFNEVQKALPRGQMDELESYCLDASTDEMLNEAMRMLALLTVAGGQA